MTYVKRGFTMLELLVAIAVIIILAGILVLALSTVTRGAQGRETKATLATLSGMLSELEAKTKLGQTSAPMQWFHNGTLRVLAAQSADPGVDFWHTTGRTVPEDPLQPLVVPNVAKRGDLDQLAANAVPDAHRNTIMAMSKLMSLPLNKSKVESLPTQRVYRMSKLVDTNTAVKEEQVPMLLDSWGNPIMFVPAGGLRGVVLSDENEYLVTSAGVRRVGPSVFATSTDRPFFASAGPDGVFGFADANNNGVFNQGTDKPGGDDNIYSFEQ